ncbi:hypothetical protein Tco_0420362 [Tanacetum coccineum]
MSNLNTYATESTRGYITSLQGIRNVSPNGVFVNEVYGGDSEGFGVNPSSDEFRLCNSNEWRSINGGGPLEIRGYGGGGDMVDQREYNVPSLSVGVDSVSTQKGGLDDGNTGNGDATRQIHEVTNDGIPNEAGFESVLKEAPTSYANKLSLAFFIKANL